MDIFISLTLLTGFILFYLSWLVFKTLKEGREALKDMKGSSK